MKNLWRRFLLAFVNGMVIMLPVFVTVIVLRFFARQLNNLVLEPVLGLVTPLVPGPADVQIAKTVIFVLVVLAVALIGWAVKIVFVRRIFVLGESVLIRLPVLGKVYNGAKQIFSAFMGQGKSVFKRVVLIEYPRKGLFSIGFTTGETKGLLKRAVGTDAVNVFLPTTPNPTSGIFLMVPTENLKVLDMTVEEGMKVVISGGSVSPLGSEVTGGPGMGFLKGDNDAG